MAAVDKRIDAVKKLLNLRFVDHVANLKAHETGVAEQLKFLDWLCWHNMDLRNGCRCREGEQCLICVPCTEPLCTLCRAHDYWRTKSNEELHRELRAQERLDALLLAKFGQKRYSIYRNKTHKALIEVCTERGLIGENHV